MKIDQITISPEKSVMDALKLMDAISRKLLIVLDSNRFISLVSIGDIQRSIIKNMPLETPLTTLIKGRPLLTANKDNDLDTIKRTMMKHRLELMPILDNEGNLFDVLFWEELFEGKEIEIEKHFNLPIVVMAGGLGTRLKPLTNVLPKPLIPIGDRSIIEEIFDRFNKFGCKNFFVSVNYKADLIEFYLKNKNLPFEIEFFREDKPLGTGGSLSLLKGKINQTLFVTNCDILIGEDYSEILNYHKEMKNEITIVAALKNYSIPYGTIESGENGQLLELVEKPEFTYKINSGMYILEPHLLHEIPEGKFFHITDLIMNLKEKNRKVGVFPIYQKDWIDVGEVPSYLKLINW